MAGIRHGKSASRYDSLPKSGGAVAAPVDEPFRGETPRWATDELNSFYGIEAVGGEVDAFEEPDLIKVEMTLDSRATTHAADRLEFSTHALQESVGSKAVQNFCCAGGKLIPNTGEFPILTIAQGGIECELETTFQSTKTTRLLVSVT